MRKSTDLCNFCTNKAVANTEEESLTVHIELVNDSNTHVTAADQQLPTTDLNIVLWQPNGLTSVQQFKSHHYANEAPSTATQSSLQASNIISDPSELSQLAESFDNSFFDDVDSQGIEPQSSNTTLPLGRQNFHLQSFYDHAAVDTILGLTTTTLSQSEMGSEPMEPIGTSDCDYTALLSGFLT